jgi:hypothetical protein
MMMTWWHVRPPESWFGVLRKALPRIFNGTSNIVEQACQAGAAIRLVICWRVRLANVIYHQLA